ERQRPHAAGDEIGEEVAAAKRRPEQRAAVDIAAGHRLPGGVIVFVDWIDERLERGRPRRDVVVHPLAVAPAVVAPAARRRLVVALLEWIRCEVADEQRAGAAARRIIEAVAPRVAQAEGPDLGPRGAADERIVRRYAVADGIAVGDADVDAQHLAEQFGRRLR